MPLRLPSAGSFEHLLSEVRVDASTLLRVSRFPKTEPWWSRGRYRFDGPPAGDPGSFGTCYAADDVGVAFSESVIHECAWFRNGHYEIAAADLDSRYIVRTRRPAKPQLLLADLTGKSLKSLGLNNDISAGDDYTVPMAWAKAIHDCDPKWDGIRYVSRQHNDMFAVALFERCGAVKSRATKLKGRQLALLCDEFGVIPV